MKLWSLQSPKAYQTLLRDGSLRGDGRCSDRDLRKHYGWMRARFEERVPSYRGGTLLWAWYSPFPDLRRSEHRGEEGGVRLELEVDPSQVLLSDFDGWHHVLNNMYLPSSVEDYEDYERRWDAREILARGVASGLKPFEYARIVDAEFRGEVEASWARCFDLPLMRALFTDPRYGSNDGGPHYVQAVFEEIRLRDVVRARVFGPRSA